MIKKRYYTGVGSRNIPEAHYKLLEEIGTKLAMLGMVLRSGAADGADTAFETGSDKVEGSEKEIYIPWQEFNGRVSSEPSVYLRGNSLDGATIVSEVHPRWVELTRGARALHTRNAFQVLGLDLKTPSEFMICYAPTTPTGVRGGTNTAYQLAKKYGVRVTNIFEEKEFQKAKEWVKSL